jgi:thiol-disulfide isomerase/thioredoxin
VTPPRTVRSSLAMSSPRPAVLCAILALATACEPHPPATDSGPLRLEPAAPGPVAALVAARIDREARAERKVLVYVGAPWCEPCRAFHEAAARGDLDRALPGLTLLEFDLDTDRSRLEAAGYRSTLGPLFARPLPDGTASGLQVEGAMKCAD